nr:JAB domain-containing protein [Caballeronia mineralivorans]
MKQEKDPLALWGGSLGPSGRGAVTAASLIVAHNHPCGGVEPSASDRRLRRVLQDSLALIDVQRLDHLVVASNEIFSFSRHGWMPA